MDDDAVACGFEGETGQEVHGEIQCLVVAVAKVVELYVDSVDSYVAHRDGGIAAVGAAGLDGMRSAADRPVHVAGDVGVVHLELDGRVAVVEVASGHRYGIAKRRLHGDMERHRTRAACGPVGDGALVGASKVGIRGVATGETGDGTRTVGFDVPVEGVGAGGQCRHHRHHVGVRVVLEPLHHGQLEHVHRVLGR